MEIQKADVITMANILKHTPLSDKRIEYILKRYDDAQADNPDDTRALVIEFLIHEVD